MNRFVTIAVALTAGMLGGLASRYLSPAVVYAQVPSQAPKELRAQSFVLVNAQGVPLGVMGIDPQGWPMITLKNETGTTIWSTRVGTRALTEASR